LNPLADEINALADRLTAINIDKITNKCRQKLDQWRIDCHQIIDQFYEEKCKELHRYANDSIDEQRKAIADLRSKMTELIEKQETTKNDINSLTSAIRTLERQLNEIEHTRVQIDICPLMIDKQLVQIGKSETHQFDLSNLPPLYQKNKQLRASSNSVASSDRFLLVRIDSNLCLIDQDLSIMKQKAWDYDRIAAMCWSSALGRFFVITAQDVLLLDENTMSIEQVPQIKGEDWWVCGCSNKSLYLSRHAWDSSLLEFSLLPTIQFAKLWKTTNRSQQKQRIDAIVYRHGTLALAINDQSSQTKLMELRSLETFSTLWSIPLDISYNIRGIRCCLLNHGEWLLADWATSNLFHITNEGKVKKTSTYTSVPFNINLFGSNILTILTKDGINFHKL
jgi:hypothetical protein